MHQFKLFNLIFEIKTSANIDMNVSTDAKKFAELMDRTAIKLNITQPIITSGLRPTNRQVDAMFRIWKKNGSKYFIDIYAVQCKSCSKSAGTIAKTLATEWDKNSRFIPKLLIPNLPNDIPPASIFIKKGIDILSNFPEGISSHQHGKALDYGLISNKEQDIENILSYITKNNLANIELIDEKKAGNDGSQQAGSHYHVTIHSITKEGIEFLKNS